MNEQNLEHIIVMRVLDCETELRRATRLRADKLLRQFRQVATWVFDVLLISVFVAGILGIVALLWHYIGFGNFLAVSDTILAWIASIVLAVGAGMAAALLGSAMWSLIRRRR